MTVFDHSFALRALRGPYGLRGPRGPRRRFLACSDAVAHRQFPESYPRSLSTRSRLYPRPGFGPMSARKVSKEASHSGQTVMPRS
jgi:hypothetical protein